MSLFDLGWTNKATNLNIRADLANGWRKVGARYKFSERDLIEFAGHGIRVTLEAYPYPHHVVANEFPSHGGARLVERGIAHVLKAGKIEIDVPLLVEEAFRDLPWKFTNNRKLAMNKITYLDLPAGSFELILWVVFQFPPNMEPRVEWDWFRKFYPGGLPGLGKKR